MSSLAIRFIFLLDFCQDSALLTTKNTNEFELSFLYLLTYSTYRAAFLYNKLAGAADCLHIMLPARPTG
jgi:hypothetical protein